MRPTLFKLVLLATAAMALNCASLTASHVAYLPVVSNPPDAEVRVDGIPVGRTPMTVALDKGNTRPFVQVLLDGYSPAVCNAHLSPGRWYVAADIAMCVLLLPPVGCIAFEDAAGAWNMLDVDQCHVDLQPVNGERYPPPPPGQNCG